MPRSLILLFFGTLVLVTCASAYNETETPEATGERVVNDVLDRFNETGLETDENVLLFMRRMAWVESKFGGYNLTFRQGFHGGIWQKSLKAFRMTQKENTMKHQQIKDLLEINWEKVPWSECRKPLYSALTVWLYLCLSPTPIPELLEEQAEFWVEYKKECAPMVQDFIDHVKVLEDPLNTNANGRDVVKQVLNRFRQSGWVTNPTVLQFLKRIALVESNFGNDPNTFRPGYFGGIWQVDNITFDDTKDTASHNGLAARLHVVNKIFGKDWVRDITWMDLTKPLYSGIAARLYLGNVAKPIPLTLQGQATYWKMYYNRNGAGTVQDFIDRVRDGERDGW